MSAYFNNSPFNAQNSEPELNMNDTFGLVDANHQDNGNNQPQHNANHHMDGFEQNDQQTDFMNQFLQNEAQAAQEELQNESMPLNFGNMQNNQNAQPMNSMSSMNSMDSMTVAMQDEASSNIPKAAKTILLDDASISVQESFEDDVEQLTQHQSMVDKKTIFEQSMVEKKSNFDQFREPDIMASREILTRSKHKRREIFSKTKKVSDQLSSDLSLTSMSSSATEKAPKKSNLKDLLGLESNFELMLDFSALSISEGQMHSTSVSSQPHRQQETYNPFAIQPDLGGINGNNGSQMSVQMAMEQSGLTNNSSSGIMFSNFTSYGSGNASRSTHGSTQGSTNSASNHANPFNGQFSFSGQFDSVNFDDMSKPSAFKKPSKNR